MKKRKVKDTKRGKRQSFSDDENVYPWLSMLLDAYFIVDKGIAQAIASEQQKDRVVACSMGCSSCCRTHKDIPVYPLELVGISWYVTEKITGLERGVLRKQLETHGAKDSCPFLLGGVCSVYPVRPIACRQFNVFGETCAQGEDPYYTRIKDILPPVKKHIDQAFFIMLPFYGIEKESERTKIVGNGDMHRMVRRMQDCNWKSLAEKMKEHDKNRNP
jgi:Fe-S-cluster containining protein